MNELSELTMFTGSILSALAVAYAIAMLQEMFHQIDYNGDGSVDWDEFTTFCIQNVHNVSASTTSGTAASAENASRRCQC